MSEVTARNRLALAAAVVLAAVALAAAGSVRFSDAEANVPQRVGFQLHSFTDETRRADVERELALIEEAGGDVARIGVVWAWLEPKRDGAFDWRWVSRLDAIAEEARQRSIDLLIVAKGTPCWASSAPRGLLGGCPVNFAAYPPRDPADYGEFVAWLSDRYGEVLAGIEVWNEANVSAHFRADDPARAYARLVIAAHAAPTGGVPIVAGALHEDGELAFMNQLYAHGIRGNYEIWSSHAYGEDVQAVVDEVAAEQQLRATHADQAPLWVTEFGWSTCQRPPLWGLVGGDCARPVTPEQQASLLPAAFRAFGDLAYVEGAIAYELRNGGTNPGAVEDNFGIVNRHFAPKPAFDAVRDCLRDPLGCGG